MCIRDRVYTTFVIKSTKAGIVDRNIYEMKGCNDFLYGGIDLDVYKRQGKLDFRRFSRHSHTAFYGNGVCRTD